MCGIAGYYYKSGKDIGNTSTLHKMLEIQKHRGPDDSGVRAFSLKSQKTKEYSNREIETLDSGFEGIIGFNRLSILDLSPNGHQPMSSADGKVMLAFNGEIYNAFDFKDELKADGYQFKSASDTEIILALYLKYGFEGMINRLNGMFAIVLVDAVKQHLFIARDRFGIKPLYVFETNELLAFSSEIKSFLKLDEFAPALDRNLLDEFLLFRNTINKTLFKGVEGLEPGTFKIYSPGGVQVKRFFSVNDYQRTGDGTSLVDSVASLQQGLKTSVQRQLLSDVKLGCQLSGGIDSSLVAYYAKQIKQDELLETISITFDNTFFNEEMYVDQVSKRLQLKSHKFRLHPAYYLQEFEKATWHFEGPLNHPNTIGIYFLSQHAKKYVTVLLSGEGADEVFGGYSRFSAVMHPFHPRVYLSNLKKNRSELLKHIFQYNSADYRAIMGSAYMMPGMARQLKNDFSSENALQSRRAIFASLDGSTFDKQVKYEVLTYLPDLLIRQDKMSMAHSIENRVPFLDNDLVKNSFTIPVNQLIGKTSHGEQTKLTLKNITNEIFGESFSYRSKGGFGIPLRDFFSDQKFNGYLMEELVPSIASRGIFDPIRIKRWVQNIKTIHPQELDALWIMVAFETWAKKFKV
jgi:asparagine synthase (glutamine-hydrolysing)